MDLKSVQGDRLIEETIKIIDNNELVTTRNGKVVCTTMDSRSFNNYYYNCATKVTSITSTKVSDQSNILVPIANSKDSLFQRAFEIKYKNGNCGVNETNNFKNQIKAINLQFTIDYLKTGLPVNYNETSLIKLIILRENIRRDRFLGPNLSSILQLTNDKDNSDIPSDSYITAFTNINSSENYQILSTRTILMQDQPKSKIENICISFANGANLEFKTTSFDNSEPPLIGNIYVIALKKVISSNIIVSNINNDMNFNPNEEAEKIISKINQFDVDTKAPVITLKTRMVYV